MPDPLPRHKHRQLDVQFDLAHLKGGRMPVPHQIADQTFVVADMFRARAIADPRRVTSAGVSSPSMARSRTPDAHTSNVAWPATAAGATTITVPNRSIRYFEPRSFRLTIGTSF
jgi:hypothetical protein